jgi:hypothetical protein
MIAFYCEGRGEIRWWEEEKKSKGKKDKTKQTKTPIK